MALSSFVGSAADGTSSGAQPLKTRATLRSSRGVLNTYAKPLLAELMFRRAAVEDPLRRQLLLAVRVLRSASTKECEVRSRVTLPGSSTRRKRRLV